MTSKANFRARSRVRRRAAACVHCTNLRPQRPSHAHCTLFYTFPLPLLLLPPLPLLTPLPQTDEECLVHVSVSGILQEDLSLLAPSQFSFIDISSSRPLVTIGGQAFVGDFQDTAGSSVFFSREQVTEERDQVFSRQPASKVIRGIVSIVELVRYFEHLNGCPP